MHLNNCTPAGRSTGVIPCAINRAQRQRRNKLYKTWKTRKVTEGHRKIAVVRRYKGTTTRAAEVTVDRGSAAPVAVFPNEHLDTGTQRVAKQTCPRRSRGSPEQLCELSS